MLDMFVILFERLKVMNFSIVSHLASISGFNEIDVHARYRFLESHHSAGIPIHWPGDPLGPASALQLRGSIRSAE